MATVRNLACIASRLGTLDVHKLLHPDLSYSVTSLVHKHFGSIVQQIIRIDRGCVHSTNFFVTFDSFPSWHFLSFFYSLHQQWHYLENSTSIIVSSLQLSSDQHSGIVMFDGVNNSKFYIFHDFFYEFNSLHDQN